MDITLHYVFGIVCYWEVPLVISQIGPVSLVRWFGSQDNQSGNFEDPVKDRGKEFRSGFLFNFPPNAGMSMLSC